MQIGILK